MNSAFFARAAQGAMSKLNEGKPGSSGGDKNGAHNMDECDPAVKESRDIASKVYLNYTLIIYVFINLLQRKETF